MLHSTKLCLACAPPGPPRTCSLVLAMILAPLLGCAESAEPVQERPSEQTADPVAAVQPVYEVRVEELPFRMLSFVIDRDDQLQIIDAQTQATLATFAATEGGFVRGLVPMLEQQRRIRRLDLASPYRLDRDANRQLRLIDPPTGTHIDIEAFGPDAVASFERLLLAEATTRVMP